VPRGGASAQLQSAEAAEEREPATALHCNQRVCCTKAVMSNYQLLLLIVSQVSGESSGLGAEFQPSVKASCVGATMTVRVDTREPFFGLVHTADREDAGCNELGRGGLKTFLTIDLATSSCGVKYDEESGDRSVVVHVRAHPTLSLLEDRLFALSCGTAGFQLAGDNLAQLAITADGETKLEAALEETSYALRASVTDPDPAKGLLVKNCQAFDGLGGSIQLVDDRACRAEKLISEFTYYDTRGVAVATVFSMLKMASSNRTFFQCDIEICSGPCPKPVCGGLYTGEDAAGLQSLSEDTVTAATSVFVAPPGSESAVAASICGAAGGLGANPTWITYLAIAFGVLFAIMLFINIFLCSAMTCSCTRTEVIEKEPSIYDDYSVYESQYGYAGKQGPYSESDLGSDYGEGSQTGDRGRGSEAGTLASRYSQRQATIPPHH